MTDYRYTLPPPPPRKERKGWLFLLVLLTFGGMGLVAFLGYFVFSLFGESKGGVDLFGKRVAVVEIDGALMDVTKWVDLLKECETTDSIAAVVVNINSPGGGIAPTQLVCEAIEKISDEGKPVIAFMNSVAASGGYYVACAADEIYAMPGTLTGSIGVYIQLMNLTELLAKIGVEFDFVKKGAFKTAGDFSREMQPFEREMFDSVVEDYYGQFLEAVAENRRENRVSVARGWNEPLPGGPVSKTRVAETGGVMYPSAGWGGGVGMTGMGLGLSASSVVLSATSATPEQVLVADDPPAATADLRAKIAEASIGEATGEGEDEEEEDDQDSDSEEETDPLVASFAKNLTDDQIDARVAELAEGRIYTGRQAHKVGLVDRLGTLDDAVKRAGKLAGIKGEPKTVTKKVKEPRGLFGALKAQVESLEGPRFSYLCPYAY